MNEYVIKAKALPNYMLKVKFDTDETKLFDFKHYLH